MSIIKNEKKVLKIYKGTQEIKKVYKGDKLVYIKN